MADNPQVKVGFGVMILKDGKVLLGKRHDDPAKASSALHGEGTWTMPGGKLHFGEHFEDAAKREVAEETGLLVKSVEVISLTNEIVSDAHFVTLGFLCKEFEGEAKALEPDEITKWEWFALDQLPNLIYGPSERVLKNYKEGRLYSSNK